MGWLRDKLDGKLFTLFSTGKPLDTSEVERTDAMDDIQKKERSKMDKKLRKMFRMD